MKIAFHYFSGCGNSAWVVMQAQKILQNTAHEIALMQNTELAMPTQMPNTDVDIFVCPTYFCGLPANFIAYLKRLPMVANRKAIFWAVNGGVAGASKFIAENLLKDRGYEVISKNTVEMPDTFLFLKLSQQTLEERKETLQKAQTQVKENLDVLNNLPVFKKESFVKNVLSLFVFMLYHLVFRHTIGLSLTTSSKCIHCGWCAQNCPVKAIRFDKQIPHFNTGCIGCFRCVNACPVSAIDYSKYAFICGGIGAVLGMLFIGKILSFFGILSVILGALLGWFVGCLIFQKCAFLFPKDKKLCFADKKRVWFCEKEKDL